MDTLTKNAAGRAEIHACIETWAEAIRSRDADGVIACFAPDPVVFDCHSHFRIRGTDAYRQHLEACFPCMQGRMVFDIHDLDITTAGDVAFCHFGAWCVATGTDGTEHACGLRSTVCFQKLGGIWLITHAHCSAPFDAHTDQAMLGNNP